MEQTLTSVLLLLSILGVFGKYVYIDKAKFWLDAQEYCQEHYTELAPVSSEHDIALLKDLISCYFDHYFFWIGLERNSTDGSKWTWSGVSEVTKFFWHNGQPDNRDYRDQGAIRGDGWHDVWQFYSLHFFCYNVVVVREKKTWVEAVDYCREHHHDLASVASEAEMMLIWRELERNETTDHVWIGLHFFPGDWLWTDGQPMDYEAWSKEGKPNCPKVELECAALRMKDQILNTNGTNSSLIDDSTGTRLSPPGMTLVSEPDVNAAESVGEKVWEAQNCDDKLYFVCY